MMKSIKTLSVALLSVCAFNSVAQTVSRVQLSAKTPVAGEKIEFTYDTIGTAIGGKPEATVCFIGKTFPVDDITLVNDGKKFKGEFIVPAKAKGFYLKFANGENVDANDGNGYLYEIYKDGKPVEGAYAIQAYLIHSGMGNYFGKIANNRERAGELYKKEFALYPQSEKEYLNTYIQYLGTSKDDAEKELFEKKGKELIEANDEQSLVALKYWYLLNKQKAMADSVNDILAAKYPKSEAARNMLAGELQEAETAQQKDSILNIYISRFSDDEDNKENIERNKSKVALAYFNEGDMAGFNKYLEQVNNKTTIASGLNNIVWDWAVEGENLDKAARYSKLVLDYMDEAYKKPVPQEFESPKQNQKNNRADYYNYVDTYAYILYKQRKFPEALKYQQLAYDSIKYESDDIAEHYVMILNANNKTVKAKEVAEKVLKSGKGSQALKDELKKIYVKLKGSTKGFNTYMASLAGVAKISKMEELAKTMINKPAPLFTLKDFDGTAVSLADLKGKTVILDFWATWCGPCKASFPGMQMVVDKYKSNPDVKFLFIDTWESGDNFLPGVKKFIADNKYSFHVLVDEKGEDGNQSKVVSSYEVEGIPTKFVIDKNGNIRFIHVGYSGSSEAVLNELVAMIELLNKPDDVKPAGTIKGR